MADALCQQELAALAEPDAHPLDPSATERLEWVQTHISHLFLSGARVYKFRKAVDLGFVCFATRQQRNDDCLREVALNRRLAPDVYLGVAPLLHDAGAVRVGRVGEALVQIAGDTPEHCVVMRRLPGGRDALSLLQRGRLGAPQLDRLAARIASFHESHGLGVPVPLPAAEWLRRCTGPAEENLRLIGRADEGQLAPETLERMRERTRWFVREHADRFERRRLTGRGVDGHGDLHLQHVWFESDASEPIVIDCLEFNEHLRRIDAAAEVAFTAMDLGYRGHRELAERFLRVYAREIDDFDLYAVVDYFASYRAAVRAKVALIAASEPEIAADQRSRAAESARRHLELAARSLSPRPPGGLVLVGGVVGSGKSSASEVLAEAIGGSPGAAVIASDRLRKRLAGLPATTRVTAERDAGLYAPEARRRVYRAVLERARAVAASGRVAILDATWSGAAQRAEARALAAELGATCWFVETRCAREVALERLAQRAAGGRDASDAGPELHAQSVARFEAFDASAEGRRWTLDTDTPSWRGEAVRIAAELAAAVAGESPSPGGA